MGQKDMSKEISVGKLARAGRAGCRSLITELLLRVRSAIPGNLGEIGRQSEMLATSMGTNPALSLEYRIRPFDLGHLD